MKGTLKLNDAHEWPFPVAGGWKTAPSAPFWQDHLGHHLGHSTGSVRLWSIIIWRGFYSSVTLSRCFWCDSYSSVTLSRCWWLGNCSCSAFLTRSSLTLGRKRRTLHRAMLITMETSKMERMRKLKANTGPLYMLRGRVQRCFLSTMVLMLFWKRQTARRGNSDLEGSSSAWMVGKIGLWINIPP